MKRLVTTTAVLAFSLGSHQMGAQQSASVSVDDYLIPQEVPRFALVVGVENYDHLELVPNALNDLTVAANALRRAGFTTVVEEPDATASRLRTALRQLTQLVNKTERPAIVAIFFAGHGFQDAENNFIVPKDARPASLLDDSVPVANVVVNLAPRKVGVTFLFLDACRTLTPLSRAGLGSESIPARLGFSQVATFDGAVISFAPGYNQAALSKAHEGDVNSPYTEALGLHLGTENVPVASTLGRLYRHVKLRTGERQQPATLYQASIDTIRFMSLTAPSELQAEERHWRAVLETKRAQCVKEFLISFPDSRFAISALRWLAETRSPSSHRLGGDPCPQR